MGSHLLQQSSFRHIWRMYFSSCEGIKREREYWIWIFSVYHWLLYLLFLVEDNLGSSESTSSSGSNETNLLSGRSESRNSCWMSNVLMVTTTMGMLNGIHGDTSDSWPAVSLNLKDKKKSRNQKFDQKLKGQFV